MYATASRDQVLDEASKLLEKVLAPYYDLFKKTLFTGAGLAAASVLLFNLNNLWSDVAGFITPRYLLLVSIFLLSAGAVLVALSVIRKRRVVVFDVQLYLVVAAPYGDGSSLVLIDVLNGIGDDVELRVLRVDRVAGDLRGLLGELSTAFEVFQKSSVDYSVLEQVLTAKTSGEETTWLFEERLQSCILRIKELLSSTPVSYPSLKLLETPSDVKLFKEPPTNSFLAGENTPELVDEATGLVSENLETLRKEYEELLNDIKTRVQSTVEYVNTGFYREVGELAEKTVSALRRSLEKQYVSLCSRCLISRPGLAMYTPNLPVLVETPATGGLSPAYTCANCGVTTEETHQTYAGDTRAVKPVRMHKAELIQSIAWSLYCISNKDAITSAIREAQRVKESKYDEARHFIEDYMKSLKEFLLPVYMQMIWYARNVEASSAVLEQVVSSSEGEKSICGKPFVSSYALDVIQKIRDLIGPGESVRKYLIEVEEARKLWTNKVFNKVVIEKIAVAYRALGQQDLARRVLELYHKMDYEEPPKLLKVKSIELG